MRKQLMKFTLIELLVVVAIMGILMSLMISGYGDMRMRAKLLQTKEQIFSIKLSVINYKKDYGHFPTVGTTSTPENQPGTIRPFKNIREKLLGDNPKQIIYMNGSGASSFLEETGNINSAAYGKYQYMIAFDYDGDGQINNNVNPYKSSSEPDLTQDDLNQDVIIWMKVSIVSLLLIHKF